MSKHKKRAETLPVNSTVEEVKAMVKEPEGRKSIANVNLADIREKATAARTDTAHIIAELEAWRDEIDATIAFLRAQKR